MYGVGKRLIMPDISVIIPIYNVEKYIKRCIDSVLAQTFFDFECILVDDGSTDGSSEICDESSKYDARIKTIHQKNAGASRARRNGLDIAKGNYILFIDSDDWIESLMLEKLYKNINKEGYDIVCCDYYQESQNILQYTKQLVNEDEELLNNKLQVFKMLIKYEFGASLCNKLVKHSIYSKVYWPKFDNGEDVAIIIQSLYYGSKIGYVKEALYHVCERSDSLSRNSRNFANNAYDGYRNWELIIIFLKEKFNNCLIDFEPELSNRINIIKWRNLRYNGIEGIRQSKMLYPPSEKEIFNKNSNMTFFAKVFLYLVCKVMT
jgi:glycosyltransferase involved in cell wall biosynthesis